MDYNFTFSNPLVREFFEGQGKSPEGLVSMYQFLHEHPLLKPSFLTEINELVEKTHEHIKKINLKSEKVLEPLIKAAVGVANNLPDNAPEQGLIHLRDLYHACLKLQTIS